MQLLHQGGCIGWRVEAKIASRGHLASSPAGEADDDETLASRCLDSPQNIRRTPRGRNCNQHIPGGSKAQHLSFKDPIITVIIGDRGENRSIGSQRNRCNWGAIVVQAREKLPGEMLRISRAAAIAGKLHLPIRYDRLDDPADDRFGRREEGRVVDRRLYCLTR